MAKTRGESRAERLRAMEELYLQRGYTDAEMAERLGVRRETVFKDRGLIKREFEEVERGRFKIKRTSYVSNIGLSPLESLPLFLFARKSARQAGLAQPYVARALEKLALCLRQPMAEKLTRSADTVLSLPQQVERVKVFERIAEAWLEGRKVDIDYVRLDGTREVRHTLSPYLIEPSVWSDSIYVIGWSEPDRKIMPFKLDRIVYASVRAEPPEPNETFDERELLKHAWGVWVAMSDPQWVRLKFTNSVAIRRLKETRWHPLQNETQDQPDGSCIWSAPVAEWREMLPWVRSWGADCVVLEPKELQETLMGEAKAMAERYGWFVSSSPESSSTPTIADTFNDFFGGER